MSDNQLATIRDELDAARFDAHLLREEKEQLRAENESLREAVKLGMHYLKGRYPIPVKEAEVLAKMQAAIGDNKDKP